MLAEKNDIEGLVWQFTLKSPLGENLNTATAYTRFTASQNFYRVIRDIQQTEGTRALFSGVKLRTFWITIGGFIYLGSLEYFKNLLDTV